MPGTGDSTSTLYEIIDVPKAKHVMFRTSIDPGSYVPTHWHRAIEIIYLLEGELEVTAENRTAHLTADQCILINTDVMHSTKCIKPNTAILLQIPVEFAELYMPDIHQLIFVLDENPANSVRQTKLLRFKETLMQMRVVNDIRPEGYLMRFNSLLFELLFQLYHNFSVKVFHSNSDQKKKDLDRLHQVIEYTSEHYNRAITLDEISQAVLLQPGYFCRFFKKRMGLTYIEYLNEYRLSFIYRDLITTTDPLQEILDRHGFTNYKIFRRVFREHFGDTPMKIRKMQGAHAVKPGLNVELEAETEKC